MYTQKNLNDSRSIVYLGEYHAYWSIYRVAVNPKYDAHSKQIFYLKELHESAINKFYERINKLVINDDIAICYVPSHNSNKTDSGIRRLARKLTTNSKKVDATQCLVRHTTIPKLATGGNRSKQVHLDSMHVINGDLIKGKKVLILDDVTTSNNSLLACKELLTKAGASEVYCLALGQTV